MRLLSDNSKVYGFDELSKEAQEKATQYIKNKKQPYHFTVNDFEWRSTGEIFPYTNNVNYC